MRKGLHAMYIVTGYALLVIVLIIGVMLLLGLRDAYKKTEDSYCASEVRAHHAIVKNTGEQITPKLVCSTGVFWPEHYDDPKEFIADEMVSCWDTFGRGKLRLFGDQGGVYCHVCSMVYLDEELVGMNDYLDTAKVKFTGPTYAQYMMGTTEGTYFEDAENPELSSITFSSDRPVGVIYRHAKGQEWHEQFWNWLLPEPERAPFIGAGLGVVAAYAGPAGWTTGAVIVSGSAVGTFAASIFGRADLDVQAGVFIRSMTPEDVARLGCTHAPTANE